MDAPGRLRTEAARVWSPRAPRPAARWWAARRDAAPSPECCSREAAEARPRVPAWAAARGTARPRRAEEGARWPPPGAPEACRVEAGAGRTPRSEFPSRRGASPRASREDAVARREAHPGPRAHPEARPDGLPRQRWECPETKAAVPPEARRECPGPRGDGPPRACRASRVHRERPDGHRRGPRVHRERLDAQRRGPRAPSRSDGRQRAPRAPSRSDAREREAGRALRLREAGPGPRRVGYPGAVGDGRGTWG